MIAGLLEATGSQERTTYLFNIVTSQAITLKKSSEWVERELRFEALAQFVESRSELLVLDLQNGLIDDQALDLYNERVGKLKPIK